MCSCVFLGWEWKPGDRPSFADVSSKLNSISDINESMLYSSTI